MSEIRTLTELHRALLDAVFAALPPAPDGAVLPELSVEYPKSVDQGDLTIRLFALAKPYRQNPAALCATVAEALPAALPGVVVSATAAGGYLNLRVAPELLFWLSVSPALEQGDAFGTSKRHGGRTLLVEYASPNTNKPLHLGHVRNICLGHSVSRLLAAVGWKVVQANLINDRGIHICKSMLAYARLGEGATPESTGEKGDHFVGRWYVAYNELEKEDPSLLDEAQALLLKWEAGDPEVRELWRRMNGWVIGGFEQTLERLGVRFDRVDLESDTYTLGKEAVALGLEKGVFTEDDGAVWLDLSDIGMDRKIFRRSDGTSVYVTQDLGTAIRRQEEEGSDGCIYVVGNEQEYHFKVLFEALRRLGYDWAAELHHLSYGMVLLPEGKMKSREGTTVDADDLIDEVLAAERQLLEEGPSAGLDDATIETIAMAALKFYLLRFTPRKGFTYDPAESVALQGDTGPYVQYVHARVASLLRKASDGGVALDHIELGLLGNDEERAIARLLLDYPRVVDACAEQLSPSPLCSWLLDTARAFSRWYTEHRILNADDPALIGARVSLAQAVAVGIRNGLGLLGIGVPERM